MENTAACWLTIDLNLLSDWCSKLNSISSLLFMLFVFRMRTVTQLNDPQFHFGPCPNKTYTKIVLNFHWIKRVIIKCHHHHHRFCHSLNVEYFILPLLLLVPYPSASTHRFSAPPTLIYDSFAWPKNLRLFLFFTTRDIKKFTEIKENCRERTTKCGVCDDDGLVRDRENHAELKQKNA